MSENQMHTWYTSTIIALFLMGTQRFLYKVSAAKSCNTAWTTFSFMGTVALLSSILFFFRKESAPNINFTLFIALVNSAAFLVATITHIEALKYLSASVVYAIIRLNIVVVVLFSVLYFRDQLTLFQVIGVCSTMAAILVLTRQPTITQTPLKRVNHGLMLVFISLICGAIASISSKFAALHSNKLAFIAISYSLSTLFSFGIRKKIQKEDAHENFKEALLIGFVMGILNFGGYYAFLKALHTGPLSIIISIIGLHFVIAIILSVLIFHEKLTRLRILGIALTIISIILLRH